MWKIGINCIKSVSANTFKQIYTRHTINQLRTTVFSAQQSHHPLLKSKNSQEENYRNYSKSSQESYRSTGGFLLSFTLWNFLTGSDKPEETEEDKLIMNIKRGVLLIQKGEYKAAERMLHLALKMAQELQNHDGITYIYDVLANLAMEAGDFEKAEKLFVQVMQRLFGDGHKEDSIKMLHISAKMAHLCHFQGNLDKAMKGFLWTLEKIEEKLKKYSTDQDLYELFGLVKNWYAQALMDKRLFADARKNFEEAYKIYTEIHGEKTEEGIMILNNLSVAANEMDDVASAIKYIMEAIKLANEFPKLVEVGVFHANLGMLYLKQGLINEALEACKLGRRLGLKLAHENAVSSADYCIEQLKKVKVAK